jgi:membrane protein
MMEGMELKAFLNNLMKHKPFIFLDQLIYRMEEDGVFAVGAQLTFFLVLSMFPFLILLLNIISYTPLVRQDVLTNAIYYLPLDVQIIINDFVNDIVAGSSQSLLSVSAIAGIWAASSGVKPVIKAINNAYDYEETRSYFKIKLLSILFTIGLLFMIVLVFFTLVIGELIGKKIFATIGQTDLFLKVWDNSRIIISLAFMIFIFALLYKYSPCVKDRKQIKFITTLPGGVFATLGWFLTSVIFSYYVNNFGNYTVTYGSIGGVIILLIWLYISSIIIVIGGEINATLEYFKLNNYKINPLKSAVSKYID